jgi:hypothetical protein
MTKRTTSFRILALAALAPLAACGDLLDVESPGRIADSDLGDASAVPGLVVGMRYDLSQAVETTLESFTLAAGELWHGGSYDWADIPRGIISIDDVGGEWNSPHQARWVAEQGVLRIQELIPQEEFNRSGLVAEAYMSAGFANRILGEIFCESVIDGGPLIQRTEHFSRAETAFTNAITVAQAANRSDIVTASYIGRAAAKAWQGDWAGATADAQQVPDDFVWYAPVDIEMRNEIAYETFDRYEYTVWGTEFENHVGDPRAPWDTVFNADGSIANGANGSTPHYQQQKYTSNDDDIALAKGTEALLLRAEAALRSNDIGGAYTLMNQARAVYGMDALTPAADINGAWDDLQFERGATLWIEGRRLWDLHRWYTAGSGAAEYHPFMEGRQSCYPISEREYNTNPNLTPP